jgi:hypothetical protein
MRPWTGRATSGPPERPRRRLTTRPRAPLPSGETGRPPTARKSRVVRNVRVGRRKSPPGWAPRGRLLGINDGGRDEESGSARGPQHGGWSRRNPNHQTHRPFPLPVRKLGSATGSALMPAMHAWLHSQPVPHHPGPADWSGPGPPPRRSLGPWPGEARRGGWQSDGKSGGWVPDQGGRHR